MANNFLFNIIGRLLDESSQASPDDRSPYRSRGGSPTAGGGVSTYKADRRTFKEVQSEIAGLKGRAAEEERLMNAYKERGIEALISRKPPRELPSPTEKTGFLGSVLGTRAARGEDRGEPAATPQPARPRGNVQFQRRLNFRNEPSDFIANPEALGLDDDLFYIIRRESGFQPNLKNTNTFFEGGGKNFGLGQMTIGNRTKYAKKFGFDPDTIDPHEQVKMVEAYIGDRYGSPKVARKFWEITEAGDKSRLKELPVKGPRGFGIRQSAEQYIENGWIGY